jgi:hypothetical protein
MRFKNHHMRALHDAAGGHGWITVTEEHDTRYLHLDGCEEGAMDLYGEDPVFNYVWFHKCSVLGQAPVRRALVLGAGAFSLPKCLAVSYPQAEIDAVDIEPELAMIGRRFFRLDRPAFARIRFHGCPAEAFLAELHSSEPRGSEPFSNRLLYDFIFDDLFDGFQHVPLAGRGAGHVGRLRAALADGGVCVKNLIWNPLAADTRQACTEVMASWREVFAGHGAIVLGDPSGGHNLLLIGSPAHLGGDWVAWHARLARAGIPQAVLVQAHGKVGFLPSYE